MRVLFSYARLFVASWLFLGGLALLFGPSAASVARDARWRERQLLTIPTDQQAKWAEERDREDAGSQAYLRLFGVVLGGFGFAGAMTSGHSFPHPGTPTPEVATGLRGRSRAMRRAVHEPRSPQRPRAPDPPRTWPSHLFLPMRELRARRPRLRCCTTRLSPRVEKTLSLTTLVARATLNLTHRFLVSRDGAEMA